MLNDDMEKRQKLVEGRQGGRRGMGERICTWRWGGDGKIMGFSVTR